MSQGSSPGAAGAGGPAAGRAGGGGAARLGGWLFRRRGWLFAPLAVFLVALGPGPAGLPALGAALALAGLGLRLWAVGHIGPRSRTRGEEAWGPCRAGPYAWVRNPLYLGNLLVWVGLASAVDRWIALPVAALVAGAYALVVRWEEANLARVLGAPYLAYRAEVPRWFPRPARGAWPGRWNLRAACRSERSTWLAVLAVAGALLARGG